MRGKEIPFIGNQLTVEDLHTGPVVVVIDKGKAKLYQAPEFGEVVVTVQNKAISMVYHKEHEKF